MAEDCSIDDAGPHILSNVFDRSEVYAASVPTMVEVDVMDATADNDDDDDDEAGFDGSGEGVEEDWKDDTEAPMPSPDSEYLDNPDSGNSKPLLRTQTPKYVLDQFSSIKEKYFVRSAGAKSIPLYEKHKTFWAPRQNPAFLHPNEVSPKHLYSPRFFLWDPMSLQSVIPCPNCKSNLIQHGIHHLPRQIVDMFDCYWMVGSRYKCSNCKDHGQQYTFVSWDHRILASLPQWLSLAFPAVLTHRSGMDRQLFKHMKLCFHSGTGAKQFSDHLRVAHKEHFDELYLQYLSLIEKGLVFHRMQKKSFPNFGAFDSDYAGFVPSVQWLWDLYDADVIKETPINDQHMSMTSVRVGATDHSHKVCHVI